VLTAFGATAVTFMMLMYAFERRHRVFVLAFALGCALSSAYGFLAGTWPFGAVEAIWALIAVHRYWQLRADVARRSRRKYAERVGGRVPLDEQGQPRALQ
jgi:dolichyl-phosphate-mannose--protein O-mannosyl transferase